MSQQAEVTVAVHPHEGLLLVKFNAEGFLVIIVPGVIAAPLDEHAQRSVGRPDGLLPFQTHGIEPPVGMQVFFLLLAQDVAVTLGVDIEYRQRARE